MRSPCRLVRLQQTVLAERLLQEGQRLEPGIPAGSSGTRCTATRHDRAAAELRRWGKGEGDAVSCILAHKVREVEWRAVLVQPRHDHLPHFCRGPHLVVATGDQEHGPLYPFDRNGGAGH
jgi:hypothetical protein